MRTWRSPSVVISAGAIPTITPAASVYLNPGQKLPDTALARVRSIGSRHCGIDVGDSAGLEEGFGWNVASTALARVRSCWRRYAESLLLQIRPHLQVGVDRPG